MEQVQAQDATTVWIFSALQQRSTMTLLARS